MAVRRNRAGGGRGGFYFTSDACGYLGWPAISRTQPVACRVVDRKHHGKIHRIVLWLDTD